MGMRAMIFSWKNGKKGNPIEFFVPYYIVVMTEMTFFNKYGHDWIGFLMKNLKKMTWEHCVFERMDIFFTKYGHENNVFFKE